MGKKNPFVFTIGFDKSDPDHVYVTELLNTTEKKAKLIVAAILAYTGRTDETGNGSISMEPDMLRPMMQRAALQHHPRLAPVVIRHPLEAGPP